MRSDFPVNSQNSKKSNKLLASCMILIIIGLSTQIISAVYRGNRSGSRRAVQGGEVSRKTHKKPVTTKPPISAKLLETEKDEKIDTPDWLRFKKVEEGQNCSAEFKWFSPEANRSITAISSFPGSGNTWARHLLHMATGYWTGNRRSSNHLKSAGWLAEDNDCKDRLTVAQKTHRLSKNQACGFESGLVLIRNPFDAILAAYNHHKAGKVGEPPMSAFIGNEWPNFIENYAMRWRIFHLEWLNRFSGPIQVSCFENLVKDPVKEVGHWLEFLQLDHRRLGCINADLVGQFHRQKTMDYSHLYAPNGVKVVHMHIANISAMLKERSLEDCTKYFKYDKCC